MNYKINDIIAYNSQGTFTVGIITMITILSESTLYGVDNVDILEENIIKVLGNAKDIKDDYEQQGLENE